MKEKGIILNLQVATFDLGKDTEKKMLKVVYALDEEDTEFFIGNSILETYTKIENLPLLKPFVLKPNIDLHLRKKGTLNGFKLQISKIQETTLK